MVLKQDGTALTGYPLKASLFFCFMLKAIFSKTMGEISVGLAII